MSDKFNYVKKGYDPASVDKYVDALEAEIKIFRDKEATINNAIISAQDSANKIVQESLSYAEQIIQNAKEQLQEITEDYKECVLSIIRIMDYKKQALQMLQKDFETIMGKYQKSVVGNDFEAMIEIIEMFQDKFQEDDISACPSE